MVWCSNTWFSTLPKAYLVSSRPAAISTAYTTRYLQEVPLGRMGKTADVAKAVLFFCSDDADWISGQVYLVDGGLMAGHYSFQGNQDFTLLEGH